MKKPVLIPHNDGVITKNYGNYLALDLSVVHHTVKRQHLYIIDTEAEIVEGDWVIFFGIKSWQDKEQPTKVTNADHFLNNKGWKKIIATTNPKLGLPLINKEFIQLFAEKQGEIDEVIISPKGQIHYRDEVTPKSAKSVEEAAIAYNDSVKSNKKGEYYHPDAIVDAVKFGVTWQKERSYSREEVEKMVDGALLESFVGWNQVSINGYTTAMKSVLRRLQNLKK